ncbi:MAG: methylenetetrahydrofolate reductase [Treponema sp.]|nr:methylenetetrahydrofolate reductase [NAD(P)H] [Treponema sp.]
MKINEILKNKKVTLSLEVFPPKQQAKLDSVLQAAKELSDLRPDFMSITYGAGGTTRANTVEVASKIQSYGTPALAHLTCIGDSREEMDKTIAQMKGAGIENVLALRGDIPAGFTPAHEGDKATIDGLDHASDLVKILKSQGLCVGGACYPEGHPESANRAEDIDNLKHKVDAGVDFLTTQMFFDNNMLYSYLYRLQSKGIHVPVLAGIMPITNSQQVERMVRLSSAYVPEKLLAICDRFADKPEAMWQAGIAYATDQIIDLISNGVKGIHIYTMNKPAVARDILSNISEIIAAENS